MAAHRTPGGPPPPSSKSTGSGLGVTAFTGRRLLPLLVDPSSGELEDFSAFEGVTAVTDGVKLVGGPDI